MSDFKKFDAAGQTIHIRKDLRVPMRDGIELAAAEWPGSVFDVGLHDLGTGRG